MLRISKNLKFFIFPKNDFSVQNKERLIISIEGNIGAGKTTFLRLLKEKSKLNFELIPEPVNQWQKLGSANENINLLELFYKDPIKWGYTFQSYCFYSRLKNWSQLQNTFPKNGIFLLERSVYSDKYIFGMNSFENGYINNAEWIIYNDWFEFLVKTLASDLNGIIYLKTNPKICLERKNKRARTEEDKIPLEYFEKIHNKHENWLGKKKFECFDKNIQILNLDCEEEFENNMKKQNELIEQTNEFIKNLKK